jgi:pyruvate dehydrogenase complex dehydrogenase (E1) component
MAMVVRANRQHAGIGGHISTFASSATLYEVGFNHFSGPKAPGTPETSSISRAMRRRAFMPGPFWRGGSPSADGKFPAGIGPAVA